jgi:hypothetical protein
MAIKDKNGNVYHLRGPNPLLKNQENWDKSKIKLINIGWTSEVIEDKREAIEEIPPYREEPIVEKPATKAVKAVDFINDIIIPREEVKIEVPKPVIHESKPQVVDVEIEVVQPQKKQVVLDVNPKLARILSQRGAEYFCVPAIGKKKHENSDGEDYETIVYGEQFIFDAVLIDQSDFQFQFWCIKDITKGSVIHKRSPERGERCWRVERSESKSGGHLVIATISDVNPDFS